MTDSNAADPVLDQYEAYPYPRRAPEDERIRLVIRAPEYLPQINHFVFGGRQSFGLGSRILVAGGGTGDEVVFFAEQLRDRGGAVVYLDQSEASMAIARARVATRGLTNVEFRRGRIEDASQEALGSFDYVHSIGVLHHIADPELGLRRLAALLRKDGGMGLMLYAPHGRRGVYQLQSLASRAFRADQPLASRVQEMMSIIGSLPHNHPFFRGGDRNHILQLLHEDPNELVDVVLHARDRPFSVGDVYAFVASANLALIEFVPFAAYHAGQTNFTLFYEPRSYVTDPALSSRLGAVPKRERQEIAELLNGGMDLHCFYAASAPSAEAQPDAAGMIPFFLPQRSCFDFVGDQLVMTDYAKKRFSFPMSPARRLLFELINDGRTVAEIIEEARSILMKRNESVADLAPVFLDLFQTLRSFNWIALRHASVKPFQNFDHMYYSGAGWAERTA